MSGVIQTYCPPIYIKISVNLHMFMLYQNYNGRGRFKLANRKRNIRIVFRASEDERDLIERKMSEAGIRNREAYLRKMSLDGYVIKVDLSDVRELVSLLRNSTNNLNQIARRVNSMNSIYESDVEDLREHYNRLWEKAEDIMRKLAEI